MSRAFDKVVIEITRDDKVITITQGIVSFKMSCDVLALGRIAKVELVPPDTSKINGFGFVAGDLVKVYFQNSFYNPNDTGELVFTGYILEYQNVYQYSGSRKILLKLIDKIGYIETANPINVGSIYKQKNIISLFSNVLKDNGYDVIVEQDFFNGNIRSNIQALANNNLILKDNATIQEGDTMGDFFERYSNKSQILFTSNANGNLLLTKEDSSATGYGLNFLNTNDPATQNNVVARTFFNTIEGRFSNISIHGTQSILENNTSQMANIIGQARDIDSPVLRTRVIKFQDPIEGTTARQLANFMVNINKSKSIYYQCMIQGFRWSDGSLVLPNKRVSINDIDIQGEFHIREVIYNYSMNNITTELIVINKNILSPDTIDVGNFGNAFNQIKNLF